MLPVSDIERAAAFYEGLGMTRVPSINPRIAWMQFGPNQLHLWRSDDAHPYNGWNHEPSPHFAAFCDDIHAALERVPQLGGTVLQTVKTRPHDGSFYFFALDLDGNRFELMQPNPNAPKLEA